MTKYIKELNDDVVFEVANALKNGKVVVFKTDTVYGIGANAFDKEACERIYEVKQRPLVKPLCVLIADVAMLEKIVETVNPIEQKLMDKFWPGPLTIKFKKRAQVLPDIVSAGDDYVRVRLLGGGTAHRLVKMAGVPVVAPSANLSGSLTGTKIESIRRELGGKVDYILDEGDVEDDTTSTIVQVEANEIVIIREGKIKQAELEAIVPVRKLML